MNNLIIQGLKITTACRYVKFTLGNDIQVKETLDNSVFEIIFPKGTVSSDILSSKIETVSEVELEPIDYQKVHTPIINMNGLKFKKLIQGDYVFNQFITGDIDEFLIDFDTTGCTLLIPKSKVDNILEYVSNLSLNPYFEIIEHVELTSLTNYYGINISSKDITLTSENSYVFNTKKKFTKYTLGMIDVQSAFITQFTKLLNDYGLSLIRYPIAENVNSVNHIVYRITELGAQQSRKTNDDESLRYAIQHKASIDFDGSFPDLVMLTDFKNKYQNLDLITNFTEFYSRDALGVDWISNIKWGIINTDFEQDYSQDNSGNNAFKCTFNAELYYYVVYDKLIYVINELILSLITKSNESELIEDSIITN